MWRTESLRVWDSREWGTPRGPFERRLREMKSLELGQMPGRPEQRREAEGSQLGQAPLNTPGFLGNTGLAGLWGACVPQGISEV